MGRIVPVPENVTNPRIHGPESCHISTRILLLRNFSREQCVQDFKKKNSWFYNFGLRDCTFFNPQELSSQIEILFWSTFCTYLRMLEKVGRSSFSDFGKKHIFSETHKHQFSKSQKLGCFLKNTKTKLHKFLFVVVQPFPPHSDVSNIFRCSNIEIHNVTDACKLCTVWEAAK